MQKNQKEESCALKESSKGSACKSCSEKEACQSKSQNENELIEKTLKKIKYKIAILSGKGGVGKSTISANIALYLAKKGYKTGIMDVDFHGPSVPRILGISEDKAELTDGKIISVKVGENLKVLSLGNIIPDIKEAVIWRGPVKISLIKQFIEYSDWEELDYLIVDCPPGTGDEPLSILQLLGADTGVIILTTPQKVAVDDVRRSITFCNRVGNPVLGLIENMSGFICSKCGNIENIFGEGGGEKLALEMHIPFLGKLPLDANVVKNSDSGLPIFENTSQPVMDAFDVIMKSIIEKKK
jgi:Mrp family chromosome partitioning ATPase